MWVKVRARALGRYRGADRWASEQVETRGAQRGWDGEGRKKVGRIGGKLAGIYALGESGEERRAGAKPGAVDTSILITWRHKARALYLDRSATKPFLFLVDAQARFDYWLCRLGSFFA